MYVTFIQLKNKLPLLSIKLGEGRYMWSYVYTSVNVCKYIQVYNYWCEYIEMDMNRLWWIYIYIYIYICRERESKIRTDGDGWRDKDWNRWIETEWDRCCPTLLNHSLDGGCFISFFLFFSFSFSLSIFFKYCICLSPFIVYYCCLPRMTDSIFLPINGWIIVTFSSWMNALSAVFRIRSRYPLQKVKSLSL